jgi:formylglycine-generating enzyme required for sulfatase activity
VGRYLMMAAAAVSLVFAAATAGNTPQLVNDGHGDFVLVSAGPFKMGDNFGDGLPREKPVHTVDLYAFYIAKY